MSLKKLQPLVVTFVNVTVIICEPKGNGFGKAVYSFDNHLTNFN